MEPRASLLEAAGNLRGRESRARAKFGLQVVGGLEASAGIGGLGRPFQPTEAKASKTKWQANRSMLCSFELKQVNQRAEALGDGVIDVASERVDERRREDPSEVPDAARGRAAQEDEGCLKRGLIR